MIGLAILGSVLLFLSPCILVCILEALGGGGRE